MIVRNLLSNIGTKEKVRLYGFTSSKPLLKQFYSMSLIYAIHTQLRLQNCAVEANEENLEKTIAHQNHPPIVTLDVSSPGNPYPMNLFAAVRVPPEGRPYQNHLALASRGAPWFVCWENLLRLSVLWIVGKADLFSFAASMHTLHANLQD